MAVAVAPAVAVAVAVDVAVAVAVAVAPVVAPVVAVVVVNMPDHGELTHLVHVHDPMHVSDLIHVIGCYLHIY